jgi:hypothetical protein
MDRRHIPATPAGVEQIIRHEFLWAMREKSATCSFGVRIFFSYPKLLLLAEVRNSEEINLPFCTETFCQDKEEKRCILELVLREGLHPVNTLFPEATYLCPLHTIPAGNVVF